MSFGGFYFWWVWVGVVFGGWFFVVDGFVGDFVDVGWVYFVGCVVVFVDVEYFF